MADYFLRFSKSYCAGTRADINKRREVVCQHLNAQYKAGRHREKLVFAAVQTQLKSAGVTITMPQYHTDKVVLLSAFRFLSAESAVKQEAVLEDFKAKKNRLGVSVAAHLMTDGIRSWADIEKLKTPPPPLPTPVAVPTRVPSPVPAESSPESFESIIKTNLSSLLSGLDRFLEEIERLRKKTSGDEEYIALLEEEVASQDGHVKDLLAKLKTADAATLEEIAVRNPGFPRLYEIAQEMKESAAKRKTDAEALRRILPSSFLWLSEKGNIEYQDIFLVELGALGTEDQERLVKQLKTLAAQGPMYASLDTRKYTFSRIPFTPYDCFSSRGSDELRFSWKKNGAVTVYWLWRKGDKRVSSNEK